jgi:alpha,alpha-trehalose phosphorylase
MLIHLLVDDEPFDVRYGQLRAHQRVLDLRAGTLTREAEWVSPAGQAVRVRSVRLVSLPQRAVAAIRYEVEVLDSAAHLVVQSELVANEPLARGMEIQDPRQAAVVEAPTPSGGAPLRRPSGSAPTPHRGQRTSSRRGNGPLRGRSNRD